MVVNEAFVRRYFPDEDPLGRQLRFPGPKRPTFTIVGVVARRAWPRRPRGGARRAFLPYWQFPESGISIVLPWRDAVGVARALAAAVTAVDPNLPVVGVQTMAEMLGTSIGQARFLATLAGGFALLAVVLAAVGIYGVMAYAVAQRTTEIGVRMALGAKTSDVFGLIVGDAVRLAAAGVVVGVGGAVLAARALAAQLFGVAPTDPLRLAGAAVALVGVVVVASVVPAWRAMRVDPIEALRAE